MRRTEEDMLNEIEQYVGKIFPGTQMTILGYERYTWYFNQNGYARSSEGEYFHRLVMDVPDGYIVDHINGDRLDNRKCNLRICKPADNSHNMKMFSTNSSGHTGVYKTKNGKYGAVIVFNYNSIRLGVFDDYESACDAYDEAKKKYHRVEGGVQNSEFAGPD